MNLRSTGSKKLGILCVSDIGFRLKYSTLKACLKWGYLVGVHKVKLQKKENLGGDNRNEVVARKTKWFKHDEDGKAEIVLSFTENFYSNEGISLSPPSSSCKLIWSPCHHFISYLHFYSPFFKFDFIYPTTLLRFQTCPSTKILNVH